MPWHEFIPGDKSTYPPNDDWHWATWKNGSVERQYFDIESPFVNILWRNCTHWAPIVPPTSPNQQSGGRWNGGCDTVTKDDQSA